MKNLVLVVILFFGFLNVNAQYSREEAIEIIKEDVIGLDSLQERYLYSKYNKLNQGDTIYLELFAGHYINPYEEAWGFFIDDAPIAFWGHPCRYVFFDVLSGEYTIYQELTPPFPFFENINQFWDQWEWLDFNDLSREEAIQIIIDEVVGQDTLSSVELFSKYDEMNLGDTIWTFYQEEFFVCPYDEQWAFFIDDGPVLNWSHECRIVFLDVSSGAYVVHQCYWPPISYFEDKILFYSQWEWIFEHEFTREEAIEIITNEVVGPDSLEMKHFFSRKEKMSFGDSLWMFNHDYYYFCPFYEQWVFFIDDIPLAYWAHSCRVIFFKVNSGVYSIYDDEWPPDPWLENFNLFLEQWDWITSVNVTETSTQNPELTLFPNPCENEISIQYNLDPDLIPDIFISDITGKTIDSFSWENQSGIIKINTSQFNSGLYFINIFENGKPVLQEKFMKLR